MNFCPSGSLSSQALNQPQPNTAVTTGESSMPRIVTASTTVLRVPRVFSRSCLSSSLLPVSFVLVMTGTNDWAKAPSAKSLLKKFGMRFAKKNTSALSEAPSTLAMAISLSIPRIRERKVAIAEIMPERSNPDFLDVFIASVAELKDRS